MAGRTETIEIHYRTMIGFHPHGVPAATPPPPVACDRDRRPQAVVLRPSSTTRRSIRREAGLIVEVIETIREVSDV